MRNMTYLTIFEIASVLIKKNHVHPFCMTKPSNKYIVLLFSRKDCKTVRLVLSPVRCDATTVLPVV